MKYIDTAKRKAVNNKADADWNTYKRLRNNVIRLIEIAKRDYFNNLLTDNIKRFFKDLVYFKETITEEKERVYSRNYSGQHQLHRQSRDSQHP